VRGDRASEENPATSSSRPGPLRDEKTEPGREAARAQPEAAEVESARLLANQARGPLRDRGMSDDQIRELADRFVAEDRGEDLDSFIDWASSRAAR